MIIIIIIMMMMMIIAMKGAIRDFYNVFTAPRIVSNTYAEVAMVRKDSSAIKFDRVEIAFI